MMGMLVVVVVIAAVGALVYSYYRRKGGGASLGRNSDDPVEIARRRYAQGEITREEFERIKLDLDDGRGE